jgi:hypothetical protein
MEKEGKWQEVRQFLLAYLEGYGAGAEADAVWDRLDLSRLYSGERLESSGEYEPAVKEYAAIRAQSPYAQAAQRGIHRVWLAYQQQELKEQTVAELLEQAEEHFSARRYLRPVGQNAYAAYQGVLALDPDHALARQRIDQIKGFYREHGEDHFERQDWRGALSYFEPYSLIDPDDLEIKEKTVLCRQSLAAAEVQQPKTQEPAGAADKDRERIRRLLEESGAESSRIMKYLFEEPGEKEGSETPW